MKGASMETHSELKYSEPSQASQVRGLLRRANLGQREAAKVLEVNEHDMNGYCAGDNVPRIVFLALERLVDMQREVRDG